MTTLAAQPVIALDAWSVLWLAGPLAVVLAVSVTLKLGQAGRIGLAAARSLVQLLAIGMVIGWVFKQDQWFYIIGLLAMMAITAGVTAGGQLRWARRWRWAVSGGLTLVLAGVTAIVLLYLARVVVGVDEWDARYLIPLGGMLLGNAMTAATLAGERVASELRQRRRDAEAMLALGASPGQAAFPAFRLAVGAAIMPTVNAMMIVGVVKLPGMMTGQMLGGSEPFQAALYQLVILVGILTTDLLAAVLTAMLTYRRFFTGAWQFDRQRLADAGASS